MRDTLALVVEHFARTSNLRAGPDEEGNDVDAEAWPLAAAIVAVTVFVNERILPKVSICRGDR